MLSWFRKYSKSWMVKTMYVLLAITFFGGFGILSNRYFREKPTEESEVAVAVVNGEEISARQFAQAYTRARRNWYQKMSRFSEEIPEELDTEALKQDVLDQLINQTLLMQEAKRLKISVSDSEVNTQISQIPYFRDQSGKFNPDVYRRVLNNLQLSPEEFEAEVHRQLLLNRVTSLIISPVAVSPEEIKAYYEKAYEELNLEYLVLDPEKRYPGLKATEQEIEQYYQAHLKDFDWPEVRKIDYLKFSISDFEKMVQIQEKDLKQYYEQSKDRYLVKPEEGHFRHILIKVEQNASEQEVKKARERADKIVSELLAGADFAELAKAYSEDTGSAVNGGDLGWAPRGRLVPEFEQAGYALPVGGVSEPTRTKFGFHIIKLEELKPAEYKPFEEVKDTIKQELIRNQAHQLAYEKAEKVLKDCLAKGIKEGAKLNGLTIFTSEYFKKGEANLEGIPDSKELSEEAFFMSQGELSEVFSGVDTLYIFELVEVKEPHQATLEEAKPKIIRKLTPELKLAKTKEDARAMLEKIRKGESLSTIARAENVKVEETGFFSRGAKFIPGIGASSEELSKLLFSLSLKEPVPSEIYDSGGKVYLFKLKDLKPANLEKFEELKAEVQNELLTRKQQETFDRYLENLKKGKVEIKQDIYNQID